MERAFKGPLQNVIHNPRDCAPLLMMAPKADVKTWPRVTSGRPVPRSASQESSFQFYNGTVGERVKKNTKWEKRGSKSKEEAPRIWKDEETGPGEHLCRNMDS